MMRVVKQRIEPPMVHRPVGPIEVGVMQDNRRGDASHEPWPSIFIHPGVEAGPARQRRINNHAGNESENSQATQRVANLAADLTGLRLPERNLAVTERT